MRFCNRFDCQFNVGELVYLRLQPYWQKYITLRKHLKLSPKFFGPFNVLSRIGTVAYRFFLVQEPYKCLPFHVEGGHSDTLIQRGLIIFKELVYLVRPVGRIITIKPQEVKTERSSLEQVILPVIVQIIILKMELAVISGVPTIVTHLAMVVLR
jgi:hypothetical protein